ncbi:MAG: leucine-rich repeat protein [Clostridia bacterium]|nr:leucine-rich repeat protein [Clostridia bacterium]
MVIKVDIDVDGEIKFKSEVETVNGFVYKDGALKPTRRNNVLKREVSAAIEGSVIIKLAITISVPILGDIAELAIGAGLELSYTKGYKFESLTVACSDITLEFVIKITYKIGWLGNEKAGFYLGGTLEEKSWEICNFHFENSKFVEKCTMNYKALTFNTGTSQKIDTQYVELGYTAKKPADPTRAGYTFEGWFADKACTRAWNFDNDTVQGDMTLYAGWMKSGSDAPTVAPGTEQPGHGTGGGDYDENIEFLEYSVYSDYVSDYVAITGYMNDPVNLRIPKTIEGIPVTTIEYDAFSDCYSLTSVTIPNSVTSIGTDAFQECSNLTSVTIPNSITSIGTDAFAYCSSLTSVTIPNSVTSIGSLTFENCSSLTSITIPNGVTRIEDFAFEECSSLTSVTIPNSVTSIGPLAFSYCSGLTSVTIPNSVTSIGRSSFSDCSRLTSVTIPNSVTSIGSYAFENCSSLTSITIPSSVTTINNTAFGSCSNLKTVYCTKGSTADNASLYKSNPTLIYTDPQSRQIAWQSPVGGYTSFALPGELLERPNLPTREGYTFKGWYKDAEFTTPWNFANDRMPDEDLTLYALWEASAGYGFAVSGGYITYYNGFLSDVIIPDTIRGQAVIGVAPGAFDYGVMSVSIPAGVSDIQPGAFSDAISLSEITVDAGNPYYKAVDGVLYTKDGSALICYPPQKAGTAFSVPDGVATISQGAFRGSGLGTVTLPHSLNAIEADAFRDCAYLESLTIPNGATSIGSGAFSNTADRFELFGSTGDNAVAQYADKNYIDYNIYDLTFYDGEDIILPTRAKAGLAISDPLADGSGYTYSGWQTSGGAMWNFDSDVMPAGELDLYAVDLVRNVYTVTFDAQGGTSVGSTDVQSGAAIPQPSPVRHNYTLTGWILSGGTTWNFETDVMPDEDITLYAVWQKTDESIEDIPFTYREENGEIIITGFLGGTWAAEIPSTIAGLPVTQIDDYAFYGDGILDELTIPDSVTTIGDYAFSESIISNVDMGSGVTLMGEMAFADCKSLNGITLSGGITDIPQGAFYGCTALMEIAIPEGVVTLGDSALSGCSYLDSLEIPSTLLAIGANALSGCERLESLNLKNVVSIGERAFKGCESVSSVSVNAGNSNFAVENNVLMNATETTVIYYPSGLSSDSYTLNKIAAPDAFMDSSIKTLTLAEGAELGEGSFRECMSLENIIFTNSGITIIPEDAFANCPSLESVDLPDGLITIGEGAFSNCRNLNGVHIPASVTSIGDGAVPATNDLVIYGTRGSAAENYAVGNGIRFVVSGGVPVESIALSAEECAVEPEKTVQLVATLTPSNTGEVDIKWTSSRENVATVDENGLVTGIQYGTATITATAANGSEATCLVTVKDADILVTGIELNFSTLELAQQYAGLITARITPDNATNRNIIWTSSDETVVIADERGRLAALKDGTAVITATAADGSGVSANCTVKVTGGYIVGDVTGDKQVNTKDVVMILNWLATAARLGNLSRVCADYNQDGKIDEADAQLILNRLAGLAA